MPLPLPNLDTRRWADLVDEGRALIPRYAPGWTDHNVHDPGITLMELFAWLIEQDIYRTNRIPARHRRKFLQLIGFLPRPPQPAHTVLAFTLQPGQSEQVLPAGVTFATPTSNTLSLRFHTLALLRVVAASMRAVQSFDGSSFVDHTRQWRDGVAFLPWGANPQPSTIADPSGSPALYLGFDQALPQAHAVSLWFHFKGLRTNQEERDRIAVETRQAAEVCQPLRPHVSCQPARPSSDPWCAPDDVQLTGGPEAPTDVPWPLHHAVRTVWEYHDDSAWRVLDQVVDETRGFTLDGAVHVTLTGPMHALSQGAVSDKYFYLRCRLVAGPPDAAPEVLGVWLNAVEAEQASPARSMFSIQPGKTPPVGQEPVVGSVGKLDVHPDQDGVLTSLAFNPTGKAPEVRILSYEPATSAPGRISATLILAERGTGLPAQQIMLPGAPVASSAVQMWTSEPGGWRLWSQRPDLDASQRTDAHFTLDAMTGAVMCGDGERGRVVPGEAPILAVYAVTTAAAGNIAAGAKWHLAQADDALNQVLLHAIPAHVEAQMFQSITNPTPATGGADTENLEHAAGRAVEALWAHERLVELSQQAQSVTLDQIDRAQVLFLPAPPRATTLLDFERLALDVPGTSVARARAWAGIDPHYPCLQAPGTVAVVIVPWLPAHRPQPTEGLLRAVYGYLDRRRVVGTRLVVVGPQYLEVRVRATVSAQPGASLDRVQQDTLDALNRFLDPLLGGSRGHGWPFGRDVYRAEIFQAMSDVRGVAHVLALELIAGDGEAQCGNLCVGPTYLVTPGTHDVMVSTTPEAR